MFNRLVCILCILFSLPLHAAEPDNVVLNKGDVSPYTGVLIPPERAGRIRLVDIDLDTCAKISVLKDDENKVLTDRLNNANAANDMLTKRLADTKEDGFFAKPLYFILGAVVTGLIAQGIYRSK